ncbi:MAG: PBECR4 domain-containing protein [Muribaculaceae bacterium]|nr:PBECR4 domain-containing protein [Muribaculaceae bacterium]
MYISKNQLVNRIKRAAAKYKQYLVGKTFLFVYENGYIEVMFTTKAFFHLTGVNSKLSAIDFYKHAVKENGLRASEIFFDSDHPFDLANLKTQHLKDLYKITVQDVLIADGVVTATANYELAVTDLKITLCLGKDTDVNGNTISNRWVPYSFRVEEIDNNKLKDLYEVKFVFYKETNLPQNTKYKDMTFGKMEDISKLSDDIKNMIDI